MLRYFLIFFLFVSTSISNAEIKEKIIQNLKDVLTMMDWNEANGIKVFRLSSEMFPHKSNPKVVDYDFDFAKDLLKQIGEKSKKSI